MKAFAGLIVASIAGLSAVAWAHGPSAPSEAAWSAKNPYQPVVGWLHPVASGRVTYPVAVFAETPDRIFIGNKGTSPAPGTNKGFDPKLAGTTVDHLLFVVDHNGKVIEEWTQWANLFGSLHKIKISPYDPENHIWVIDRASQQVLEFTHDGKALVMALGERGVAGNDDKHFGRPTDIAWLPDGTFFVSDGYDNARIVKFDRTGRFLTSWGTHGSGVGQFHEPHSIAVDAKHRVYVADRENKRVQIFDENGRFLAQWTHFQSPAAITVTPDQSVWVLDNATAKLGKYDARGRLLTSWGTKGEFDGGMYDPHDFSVDSEGNVYVVNGHAHRVDKYIAKLGAAAARLIQPPPVGPSTRQVAREQR